MTSPRRPANLYGMGTAVYAERDGKIEENPVPEFSEKFDYEVDDFQVYAGIKFYFGQGGTLVERQRTAFEGVAERRVVDQPRFLRHGIEKGNDIVVAACLHVLGPLGPGLNLRLQYQTPNRTED